MHSAHLNYATRQGNLALRQLPACSGGTASVNALSNRGSSSPRRPLPRADPLCCALAVGQPEGMGVSSADAERCRPATLANDVTIFVALLATALALGGALAHALELPNKLSMTREDYFTAQQIYRGWNQPAYLLGVELAAIIGLAVRFWQSPRILRPALMAILALVAAQLVFWIWTFPANVATNNWTMAPSDWETLRAQWEYSHLAGGTCQLLALSSLIVAALARRRTIDG